MSWHLLIPHQIVKYLSEPPAVVSFLVDSTKFIQQSFIECFSVRARGWGLKNEPRSPSVETSVETSVLLGRDVGWRGSPTSWRRCGLSRLKGRGGTTQAGRVVER